MTPPLRAALLRGVALLAALAGLLVLLTGVVRAGSAGDPDETTGATSRLDDAPVVTTSPAVLAAGPQQVVLRATATTAQRPVFVGVARARDVEAWLGDLGRVEVRGPGEGVQDAGDEQPAEGSLELAVRDGSAQVPDPAQADIWVAGASAQGAAQLRWTPAEGDWRAVVVAGEAAGGLDSFGVTWTRPAEGSGAPALVAVGLLLLVAGGVAFVALGRSGRRTPQDEWFDDRPGDDPDGHDDRDDDPPAGGAGGGHDGHDDGATTVIPRVHGRRRAGTPPWSARVVTGLSAGLVAGLALSGCSGGSGPVPAAGTGTPAAGTSPASPAAALPVVLVSQADGVLDRVDAAAAAAARSGRVDDFGARAAGPYRERLAADLKVRAATGDRSASASPSASPSASASASASATGAAASPVVTGLTRDRLLVTAQDGWPRFFVVAGTAPGLPTPLLRVLRSASAREPYAVWAEPALLPGATLPEVAPATQGAPALPDDADGLVASPADVARGYADLLTKGSDSDAADLFEPDDFRRQVQARTADDREGVEAVGTATSTHRVRDDGVLALRTADGGAVVIAALEQTTDVRIRSGAGTVTVDAALRALGGEATYSSRLTRRSSEVLVFAVPPEGGGTVRLVAAAKGDVAVTGS